MDSFDLVVIGGGPAGYAAAMRAVDFHKRVLLVERQRLGGAGIFNGALSSKTFWELSKEIQTVREKFSRYGVAAPDVSFDAIVREVNAAVRERSEQLADHLARVGQEAEGRMAFMQGNGRLEGPDTVIVDGPDGARRVQAEHVILATGSRPRVLPTIPVDERIILTSDGIGTLQDFPESIVILGAGVIGCEFATIFSNFGRTRVHLIDKEPRILPFEDEDISRIVQANLEANGVVIHHGARLNTMEVVDGQVQYTLDYTDGRQEVIHVQKALISVGRVPNVEGLGLEAAGVAQTPSGHLVDEDTRSSIPTIYGVGDLTADIALVNVGELEGRHAVEKIFGQPRRPLIYENISTIMFLNPEVAGVGMNELTARKNGIAYRMATFDFACIPRATAMRRTQGFFKILITDDAEGRILGMRAIGEHASSAIQAVALLISMDKGIEELAELIHPHPSIIEGIQECVRMLLGKSIYKPSVFGHYLSTRRFDGQRVVEEVVG